MKTYREKCCLQFLLRRHSSPYCCWSLWWISVDGTFSPTRNLITMRCSTLRDTFCSLITLATPRQDWTGSNPSRREGGGCDFTLSRSHSCCAVRLVYTQISPGHIWTTLYIISHVRSRKLHITERFTSKSRIVDPLAKTSILAPRIWGKGVWLLYFCKIFGPRNYANKSGDIKRLWNIYPGIIFDITRAVLIHTTWYDYTKRWRHRTA